MKGWDYYLLSVLFGWDVRGNGCDRGALTRWIGIYWCIVCIIGYDRISPVKSSGISSFIVLLIVLLFFFDPLYVLSGRTTTTHWRHRSHCALRTATDFVAMFSNKQWQVPTGVGHLWLSMLYQQSRLAEFGEHVLLWLWCRLHRRKPFWFLLTILSKTDYLHLMLSVRWLVLCWILSSPYVMGTELPFCF